MASLSRARSFSIPSLAAGVSIAAVIMLLSGGRALAETPPGCSLYASPGGADSARGTIEAPFATIQHLANSLAAGQTGCARGGSYTQDVTVGHGGSAGAPLTITSYPGERATLVGRLYLREGANYVTFSNMNLNGKNSSLLPSPTVNDTNATFVGNDVTNEHTEICFLVGSSWGRAKGTLIERNRIHDCGVLPAANHDHGIYVDEADNTQIVENVIYRNADRGIQLYPDAQGTIIEHNIIDANGEGIIFSGASGVASNNNTVRDNIITNAVLRDDVESWYPSGNPIGQGNSVQANCVWGGASGTIQTSPIGFAATLNITANPEYANTATGDYRVNATSPCAALLTGSAIPTRPFNATEATTEGTGATTGTEGTPGGTTGGATEETKTHGHHPLKTATAARLAAKRHGRHRQHGRRHARHHHAKRATRHPRATRSR
jgi:parallel beta-helix repeat protein